MSRPLFSVVIATYGRGEHIRPTIESALRQTCSDFELLVVGDGCTDETEAVVRSYDSAKIRWLNREENSGGQSAPNNLGIEMAEGDWVAYLGHDDIWSPHHLEALRDLIRKEPATGFAVGGCIYYGPPGSEVYWVTGLFDEDGAKFEHFFPPSSLAHRRELADRIGGWRPPRSTPAPVDCDFLLRAAHAGVRFSSTGQVTTHKFAAGHRYLSYLRPESFEQWAALRDASLDDPDRLRPILESSRRQGRFMRMTYPDFSQFEPGRFYADNRANKGLARPALTRLTGRALIAQSGEPRGLDWHALEEGASPFRWSGPNPRPKVLLPYTHDGLARITLCLAAEGAPSWAVRMSVNGEPCAFAVRHLAGGGHALVTESRLDPADYSVLALHTPMFCPDETLANADFRRLGIALGDVILEPLEVSPAP
jgi:glycosyltransferase involved in cell wall biosynthesis